MACEGEKPILDIALADGKYRVLLTRNDGLRALRYGEEWRDLAGDKLVLALAIEVERLRGLCTATANWLACVDFASDETLRAAVKAVLLGLRGAPANDGAAGEARDA